MMTNVGPTDGCSCGTCEKIREAQLAIRKANDAKKKPCSHCKAKPGQCCSEEGRKRALPHAARYAA